MYSPRIPERFIPLLYRLGRERRRPMTHLVAEAVERYLVAEGALGGDGPREHAAGAGAEERHAA